MNLKFTISGIFVFLMSLGIMAQTTDNDVYKGVVRIKLKEQALNKAVKKNSSFGTANLLKAGESGFVQTTIRSIDNLNQRFNVHKMKRVFRYGGKFEERHRAFGLHLWYEVEYSSEAELKTVMQSFKGLAEVQTAEFKRKVKRVDYKIAKKVAAPTPTLPGAPVLSSGTNDPLFSDQWHYENTGQNSGTAGCDISLLEAWQLETGNSNVIVAIEDGGIDWDHEDLAANMWTNPGEIAGNGIDDDNNGYVDDVYGYNFGDDTGAIYVGDHGTHVAGTVAAVTNNGVGVSGIAGGSGSGDGIRLMSCNVFGSSSDGFDEAFIYAADNGAVISQNSWGYTSAGVKEQAVLDAIDYFVANAGGSNAPMQGGLVVFAAGNDGADGQWYPGYYSSCLTVAATNKNDKKSYYSNYGTWVDIAAPGGELETSNTDPTAIHSTLPNNEYGVMQGTSMACPHVSGVAALIVSRYAGSITPQEVWDYLVDNTDAIDNLNSSYSGKLGSGRLNAYAALSAGQVTVPATPTGLAATNIKATEFTITWSTVAGAASYDVQVRESGTSAWNTQNTNATSLTISDATNSTTYEFRVLAKNTAGTSSYSSVVTATTLDSDPVVINYCTSQGNDASYEWISKVEIGSFSNSSNSASYTDFTDQTISLNAGQSYDLTLTPGFASSTYNEYWKIWIDYDQDGTFADDELAFDAGAVSKTAVSGTLMVDASAAGTTRMRVSMKYNGSQTACESFSYGEVEDYTVSITQGELVCDAPVNLSVSGISDATATVTWDAVSSASSYELDYRVSGGSWITVGASAASYTLSGLSAETDYEVRVRTACSFGTSDYTSTVSFTTEAEPTTVLEYCTTGGSTTNYEWIDLVEVGSISRSSGAEGGYVDATSLSATLQRGASTTISFSAGFKSRSYTENWYVWIDLNQDGDFEDNDELLVSGSSSSSSTLSATLAIPSSASLGTTRMRVTMSDSETTSCGSYTYGETEDFTVVISDQAQAIATQTAFAEAVNNELVNRTLSVYPNPTDDNLNLNFKADGLTLIKVYSLKGELQKAKQIEVQDGISVRDLSTGTYIITVSDGQKTWKQKFVKQ